MKSIRILISLASLLPLAAPCAPIGVDPVAACAHALEANVRRWAELESRYSSLPASTPGNGGLVNAMLGEGFAGELSALDDATKRIPSAWIAGEVERLDRAWPQFSPAPYLERALEPLSTRFGAVVDLMNGGPFTADGPPVFTDRGKPVIDRADFAHRYFFGDEDPFVIGEYHWAKLERLHRDRALPARTAYLDLVADRTYIDEVFTPVRDVLALNRRISPNYARVLKDVGEVRRANDRPDLFKGWLPVATFDVSDHAPQGHDYVNYLVAVPLPVGEYGMRLNRNLRRTVQILAGRLRADDGASREHRADQAAPGLLARETSRGRARVRTDRWSTVGVTQLEGFVSIAQYVNLLLHDRVGGRDADAMVMDLLTPGPDGAPAPLIEFTRPVRTAVLKASTLLGLRYPRPLMREGQALRLRPAFANELNRIGEMHLRERAHDGGPEDTLRDDRPCPLSLPTGCPDRAVGLQSALNAFARVYRAVAREEWHFNRDVAGRFAPTE